MSTLEHNDIFPRFFFAAFAATISVALLNGYPLLFPDSYGYIGFDPENGTNSMRKVTLDFLAHLFYPLFGIWSVVLIQTTVFSYAAAKFTSGYLSRITAFELVTMILISQVPLYSALAMADIWLVILIMAYLVLLREFHWTSLFLLVFGITVHGSHLYIFGAAVAAALILLPRRIYNLKISLSALLLASLLTISVNGMTGHDKSQELSWNLTGSKILMQIPEAIELKCSEDVDFMMCDHRENIKMASSDWCTDMLPDCFLWRERSFFKQMDQTELDTASRELLLFTLKNMPAEFIRNTLADMIELFKPGCTGIGAPLGDASPGIESAIAGAPMHHFGVRTVNPHYDRTLQATGSLVAPSVCSARIRLSYSTYLLGLIGLLALLALRSWKAVRLSLFCIAVLLANDLLFAAVSGAYERYHDRALFLLLVPALLALNELHYKYSKN